MGDFTPGGKETDFNRVNGKNGGETGKNCGSGPIPGDVSALWNRVERCGRPWNLLECGGCLEKRRP